MARMTVERAPDAARQEALGVCAWPIWTKEVGEFDWEYDEPETCYFLEGEVEVTSEDGAETARFGKGDLVTFPRGLRCTWRILTPVRKHYRFG